MDTLKQASKLEQETRRYSEAVTAYEKEMSKITSDGVITDEELKKLDEISKVMSDASQRFDRVLEKLKGLQKKS